MVFKKSCEKKTSNLPVQVDQRRKNVPLQYLGLCDFSFSFSSKNSIWFCSIFYKQIKIPCKTQVKVL